MASNASTEPAAVVITCGYVDLNADLTLPADEPHGVVLFAHGSGSSRLSPRNRAVARRLVASGLATVLLDLLTDEEERVDRRTRAFRFDIPRLAERLEWASDWLGQQRTMRGKPLGYFGASTGSAAALIAAARQPSRVVAVVSRGGRPDLAQAHLARVRAPTLLIVGGRDPEVIDLNRQAALAMRCPVEMEIVTGASHLFEEAGALEQVGDLAAAWFLKHFRTHAPPSQTRLTRAPSGRLST